MIIGLSGKIGSGKDTVADIIKKHYPLFINKSFAYKLKHIVAILTGTTIEENINRKGKTKYLEEWDMTLGQMQQKIGTECFRDTFNKNTWIIALLSEYNNVKDNWIVTDVRFPNELENIKIKDPNSIIIRINGDPLKIRNNNEKKDEKRDNNHPSETALDNYEHFDYIIENNGTLEELETKILNLPNQPFSKEK
jgi:dephospho-CoA kinase